MGKYNSYLPVEVAVKDLSDGTGKLISFFGISSQVMPDVLGRLVIKQPGMPFPKVIESKNIIKAWSKGTNLFVTVANDKIDAFIDSGLKSIQSALIKGGYDGDGVLRLTDEVASRCDTISKEEMNQLYSDAAASEIDMWQNYLNNVEDPKTREMLQLYSQIYGNTVWGHALSLKNAMTIRSIDPNATFVLGKTSWAKYGRGVKRGAKRFPLWGYNTTNKVSNDDLKAAQEMLGHGLEAFDELGVAVKDAITKKAGALADEKNGKKFFPYRYIGYDISDTYRYNPNEDDPLQSKPGISSNVVYKLNQLAQQVENEKGVNRGKDLEGYDEMVAKTQKALNAVEEMCAEKGVQITSNSQEPSTRLADILLDYYKPLVSKKANVLKDGNIMQYAEDAVQLTLLMNNIALDQLNRFRHSYEYTQKEAAALAPIIRSATYRIGKAVNTISEGVIKENGDDFLMRYKAALKQLGIKIVKDTPQQNIETEEPIMGESIESIKENFYKVFNKINSDIF